MLVFINCGKNVIVTVQGMEGRVAI